MQSHHFEYNFIIFLTLTPPATGLQNSSFLMQISSFLIHNSSLFLTLQSPPLSAVRVSSLLHHEMIVSKTIHFVLKWWTLYQKWRVPWIGVRRFPHPLRYELRGDVSNAFTTDLALKLMNSALNLMSLYFKWWILHLKKRNGAFKMVSFAFKKRNCAFKNGELCIKKRGIVHLKMVNFAFKKEELCI